MRTRRRSILKGLALLVTVAASPALSQSADTGSLDGIWEGPWYRGMSSGKARFEIRDGGGTMRVSSASATARRTLGVLGLLELLGFESDSAHDASRGSAG